MHMIRKDDPAVKPEWVPASHISHDAAKQVDLANEQVIAASPQ